MKKENLTVNIIALLTWIKCAIYFTGSDIRLVGGQNCLEGRIEVLYDGEWGTVCNNGFGNIEARIVCKAVGFR
jgi:hypothetical protein